MSKPPAPALLAKLTVTDYFKPHQSEAILRIRNSILSLVVLLLVTYLLPLPGPLTSLVVMTARGSPASLWWKATCAIELVFTGLLSLNIFQAIFALKYPRVSHPPLPSPAKSIKISPQIQKRRLGGLSPKTSPQTQRSFSSSYASSPVSTPSRTLFYHVPSSASPFDGSFNSSLSMSSTPSILASPLAAYRGKHSSTAGHAFDGSLLHSLSTNEFDEE